MIPHEPPRRPQLGFLFVPPYRIQGLSIAGEESVVQIPELDVVFDIGRCPRSVLSSPYVALTHGHMDHSAGLAYYFSQRHFQGMGTGTVVCHPKLEQPIRNIMRAWVDLEAQRTPFNVAPLDHEEELEVKNHMFLRAFKTNHTVPSIGYVIVEKRSKLREQYHGLKQEELVALKKKGEQITRIIEVPQVCYTGDTYWGEHFDREDVMEAPILITECTFLENEHKSRAHVGKHLHLDDIVRLLRRSKAKAIILTHLSRRTHLSVARKQIYEGIPEDQRDRVFLLMDNRANRQRLEQQVAESEDNEVKDESETS